MRNSRVLIVEDEEAIAKMIAMNLKVADYEVSICDNGLEAAKSLEKNHEYDIAILDIMLPGMNGLELMGHIKKYDIPVIFLTAKDDIETKVNGLRGGADDYIVKPFEVLELMVRMENVLKRNNKNIKSVSILGVDIDFEERCVRKNGAEIPLKPLEFELLRLLVKNKNIAISREKLLNMVWGVDYVGETRTVDVHIGQLRKKLGWGEHIKTVSKVGYRLED